MKSEKDLLDNENGIAVIGLALRFPGAASVEEFWQNLRAGVSSISHFSDEELISSGIDTASLKLPNYVKAKGVIEGEDLFDAAFFGFTPREASVTDPQQRIFLECAWEALESGGYDPQAYKGSVGVYAGMAMSSYLFRLVSHPDLVKSIGGYQLGISNDKDHLATLVSYKLNLKGPSVSVQTSCSTSLVATHMACQSLLNGECDMAIAGGVTIKVPQRSGYFYRDGGITSPDGRCRSFDAAAQGTVGGNGAGVVLLKRLSDALADGDSIHAVIKGSAINNDGSLKIGYTAPSQQGQASVISEALAMAGVSADSISYVEAHGTATALGDPIEVSALSEAYRATTAARQYCALGSVKSNIGHLDTAAGVAGLIKTVLMLRHRELVPSLHYEEANPQIDFAASPFYVNTSLRPWLANGTARRAGVSSFGIGGTNAHVILEEAPEMLSSETVRPVQLLTLSAATEASLERATSNLARHLQEHKDINLADVAYTLQVGRRVFKHRRVVVCRDLSSAVSALETRDPEKVFTGSSGSDKQPAVFMFSGQGAQHVNMGLELYQTEPQFRQQVDACTELLRKPLGLDLREVLYPKTHTEEAARLINETAVAQPALFVVEYALAQMLMSWGVRPSAMIGHSIGEYTAACVAGVMKLEDALALVEARGRLMQEMPRGAMLALNLGEADVAQLVAGRALSLAAVNGPKQTVVSGAETDVETFEAELQQRSVVYKRLRTSHAFHSDMMEPAMLRFEDEFAGVSLNAPQIPYISNLTGNWITAAEATSAKYWAQHLRQAVRFSDGLAVLINQDEGVLLEVGPGHVLSNLARLQSTLSKVRHPVLATLGAEHSPASDAESVIGALGRLWLAGVEVKWDEFHAQEKRYRVPLPTYPFERQRHWVDVPEKRDTALQPTTPPRTPVAPPVKATNGNNGANGSNASHTPISTIDLILRQQLEIMGQQLEMLSCDQ